MPSHGQTPLWGGDLPAAGGQGSDPGQQDFDQKIGRFYYDNGDPERSIECLAEQGMAVHAVELKTRPRIDGVLDEPAWEGITPLTKFYQCIYKMRAHPIRRLGDRG